MSLNRRKFLAASAVIGSAVALAPVMKRSATWLVNAHTEYTSVSPVQILRPAQAVGDSFERGVRAYLQAAGIEPVLISVQTTPGRLDLLQWQNLMSLAEDSVLVGMASQADFILVNECIREQGGRLLYQGAHIVGDAFTSTKASYTSFMIGVQPQEAQPGRVGIGLKG